MISCSHWGMFHYSGFPEDRRIYWIDDFWLVV